VKWNEDYRDSASSLTALFKCPLEGKKGGMIEVMSKLPRAAAPGTKFLYSTGETCLEGEVLTAALKGESMAAYLSRKLWAKMGMESDGYWLLESPDGHEFAGGNLSMTLRDYGRFGMFILHNGVLNGDSLLPSGWVSQISSPPANAPQLIRSARELGYTGLISTETAQDAAVLAEGAGELANGFISVGGASTPELASDAMKEFVTRYTAMFGEYNDESNTKVYALEYILATMAANPAAIEDVAAFKTTMDTFEAPNPYMVGDAKLKYVGMTSFGQKRQVSVPLVVNVYKDGKFETLFVAQVD
jgi:CubicO group peptidase (beta-lactamase class C family)